MRESKIEKYLVNKMEQVGGECIKLQVRSWPDRLCIFKDGPIIFVETKAPGKDLRKNQQETANNLKRIGHRVYKIDSQPRVDAFIKAIIREQHEISTPDN